MNDILSAHLGEFLALITALVWAVAVILFKKSGESVHPIALNLFKNLLAMTLLVPTLLVIGQELFPAVPMSNYLLLLASGALGIGIGDTLFLMSLNLLGAGLSAIVVCLYSPTIIVLSLLFLGESLSWWQLLGATMIISAVLTAGLEKPAGGMDRKQVLKGILLGAAAQIVNGIAIVMIKPLLDDAPVFWVAEIRVAGGAMAVLAILWLFPNRLAILKSLLVARSWGYTVAGSFTGAYLAMSLWLGGMKFTQASTASALNQTSNIIVFILAAVFLKERVTAWRVLGILLAVCGAILVTLS